MDQITLALIMVFLILVVLKQKQTALATKLWRFISLS